MGGKHTEMFIQISQAVDKGDYLQTIIKSSKTYHQVHAELTDGQICLSQGIQGCVTLT